MSRRATGPGLKIALAGLLTAGAAGCAAIRPAGDLEAALARIEGVEATVAAIRTGDIAVGGGGDSVTAWLYALIAGAAVFYPLIVRPIRRRWQNAEDFENR